MKSFLGAIAAKRRGGSSVITGGVETEVGDFKIHTFIADGNLIVPADTLVDCMLVGGGGGGGGFGGGGGGQVKRLLPVRLLTPTTYPVVVGAGGVAVAGGAHGAEQGGDGGASTFDSETADGGGGGGAFDDTLSPGRAGASGGGGGTNSTAPYTGRAGGSATAGEAGGSGVTGATAGGGGGGADTPGANGVTTTGGDGGDGIADDISGASLPYGAGGGGAGQLTRSNGGSSNTGGKGGSYNGDVGPGATAPVANSGSGGGGKYANQTAPATAGAKGTVVIRYPNATHPYTIWKDRVILAGGTFESDSKEIALNLVNALKASGFYSKIVWFAPFLGANLAAARVPLIDVLNVGIMANTGFVDGDFDQATGLQGNGSSKYLDSLIKPSQLGASDNGGMGWWETNFTGSGNVEPMGCYNSGSSQRYVVDVRGDAFRFFWGATTGGANDGEAGGNHHYYGQRVSATDRTCYKNGTQPGAANTANPSVSGSADNTIYICGANESPVAPWPGRGAAAYMTDGTLSLGNIADLHALLGTYLMTPTGR